MHADLVVVGSGSAGAVIAARVTERSDREVLLLEAGPDYEGELPRDLRDGTRNSMRAHDWGLRHRPTKNQILFDFPRGRVVGGSSAVNTCIAIRGNRRDYDEWAALGLPAWSFDQCLPAFKRLEHDLDFDNEWHGKTGPIPVRRHPPRELARWQAAFLEGCAELGFEACADSNDPTTTGYGPHAMNKIDGERMSAARCYLDAKTRARPNLRLQARTLVRRVLFANRRVVGVEVERDGVIETIESSRVVLSAGAIATPGILLRSGVGPRGAVERIGVASIADVKQIGARLLDHPGAAIFMVPKPGVCDVRDPLIQTVLRYRSEHGTPNDMQLQPGSHLPLPGAGFSVPLVSLMCNVGKPHGVGRLLFSSADPRASPRIDSELLHDDGDREKATEAMELAWLIATSKAMKDLAVFFWPGERTLRSRRRTDAWIWRSCDSGYHPSGTVPMGVGEAGACDQHGRVRGVEGLIVADASIMPTIPMANTNVPTLMIGERFGEWLRDGAIYG